MAYKYERDETVFGNWLKGIVSDALREGIVDLHEIKDLYDVVSKVSYDNGYKHGKNDGYLEAVKNMEMEKELPEDLDRAAGYDLSEHKE